MYLPCEDRSKPFGLGERDTAGGQSERILVASIMHQEISK